MQGRETPPIIVPIVLCGGQGSRLAPVSTSARPKQFLSRSASGISFLQMAIERAIHCTHAPIEDTVIVTHADYTQMVRQQVAAMGLCPDLPHIIAEPYVRNTAAAIYLSALYVAENYADNAVMLILPSDHVIENAGEMIGAIARGAIRAAQGKIVAIGLSPTEPSAAYGYIRAGQTDADGIAPITGFVEKPPAVAAAAYMRRGYLWNSGIFMACPRDIFMEFAQLAPFIAAGMQSAVHITKKRVQFDAELYKTVPAVQYDRAIMEKTDKAWVIPCKLDWYDIGSDIGLVYQGRAETHNQKDVTKYDHQAEQRSI